MLLAGYTLLEIQMKMMKTAIYVLDIFYFSVKFMMFYYLLKTFVWTLSKKLPFSLFYDHMYTLCTELFYRNSEWLVIYACNLQKILVAFLFRIPITIFHGRIPLENKSYENGNFDLMINISLQWKRIQVEGK